MIKTTHSAWLNLANGLMLPRTKPRYVVLIYNGFFDASRTQSDPDVLTVAGVVATHHDWADFDQKWLAVMAEHKVKHFHMKDFAHFKGDFQQGWSGAENAEKRADFLETLLIFTTEAALKVFVTTLVMRDFREINKRYQAEEGFGGAYALAQANCLVRAHDWILGDGSPTDGLEYFVERGDEGQGAFLKVIRRILGDVANSVVLIDKTDARGEDRTPLHVPDFVAYEFGSEHRHMATTGKEKLVPRKALTAIRNMLYPDVGIVERNIMEEMCKQSDIPLR